MVCHFDAIVHAVEGKPAPDSARAKRRAILKRRSVKRDIAESAVPVADDFVHPIISRPPRDDARRHIHRIRDDDGKLLICRCIHAIRHADGKGVTAIHARLAARRHIRLIIQSRKRQMRRQTAADHCKAVWPRAAVCFEFPTFCGEVCGGEKRRRTGQHTRTQAHRPRVVAVAERRAVIERAVIAIRVSEEKPRRSWRDDDLLLHARRRVAVADEKYLPQRGRERREILAKRTRREIQTRWLRRWLRCAEKNAHKRGRVVAIQVAGDAADAGQIARAPGRVCAVRAARIHARIQHADDLWEGHKLPRETGDCERWWQHAALRGRGETCVEDVRLGTNCGEVKRLRSCSCRVKHETEIIRVAIGVIPRHTLCGEHHTDSTCAARHTRSGGSREELRFIAAIRSAWSIDNERAERSRRPIQKSGRE